MEGFQTQLLLIVQFVDYCSCQSTNACLFHMSALTKEGGGHFFYISGASPSIQLRLQ